MTYAAAPVTAAAGIVVDTNTKLTTHAAAFAAAGVAAVCRYVPLPGNGAAGDLDAEEIAALTENQIAVFAVQHPRSPANNRINADSGAADSAHAIQYARSIGYMPGASLALDMEGVAPGSDAMGHATAWIAPVLAAGYRATVYVGYCSMLSTAHLAELAAMGDVEFWCDAAPLAQRPTPPGGYALKQHMQSTLAGVGVDRDDVMRDGAVYAMVAVDTATDTADPVANFPLPFNPESNPPDAA